MQESQVQSLGWEDPLEKEIATHSSTLASLTQSIPWMEESGGLQSMRLQRVRHDFTFTFTFAFAGVVTLKVKERLCSQAAYNVIEGKDNLGMRLGQ